ncbi:unnamed protein product [Oppiella nova]|uniref:C2H2-type domain-containing protein n=1 Tax=Oppiella nova TaxID=334625 RepID=A0A7R9QUU3_9ACAR|nr:unnamed protein product [Oppiella nova]CAG2174843.1 unnamed protein product [Oppiella nova]
MNESDCEELVDSICHQLSQLVSDVTVRDQLISDLKLVNNSYKSIIEWKVRQITKLTDQLRQLTDTTCGEEHIHTDDNDTQSSSHGSVQMNANNNNLFIFATQLLSNSDQTNKDTANGHVHQSGPQNDSISEDTKPLVNGNESADNRYSDGVQCVQTLSIDNSRGIESEDNDDYNSEDNSYSDSYGENGVIRCHELSKSVEFESKAGRHCRSLVWKYFRYDSDTNITHCLVNECTSKGIKGKLAGNLKRHLRKHHKQFQQFMKAVNRLELNITHNKKVLNKCSMDSQDMSTGAEERSFQLYEVNDYLVSTPRDETAADVVYPNRRSSIGRKYESSVWKFFAYDSMANIAYCLVTNCKSKGIRGKLAGNLRKHLLTHKREYDELMSKESNCAKNEVLIGCVVPNSMNESDCEELVDSICHQLSQLVSDVTVRDQLISDLKLVNNSYKSIIEWKVRQITKLTDQLRQLTDTTCGEEHIHTDDNDTQSSSHGSVQMNANNNNLFIFATQLLSNSDQTNKDTANGHVHQSGPQNDSISEDTKPLVNGNESADNRYSDGVQCVQTLSIDNSRGIESEDNDDYNSEDNSYSDSYGENGVIRCHELSKSVEFESKAGRHCRSLVWKYFRYDSDTNITHCLVNECTSKGIKGKLAGNLKRHLRKHHKQFQQFMKAVNRLELNITHNKKVLNKCSMDSQDMSTGAEERSFQLYEVNDYLVSTPRDETAADVVYPNRRSSIGRKYESSVWKFFAYDSMANIAYCLVTNCKSKGIRGKLAGNLRKHLLTHKREYDELMSKESNCAKNEVLIGCVVPNCHRLYSNQLDLRQHMLCGHHSNVSPLEGHAI